ncbi:MAG: hypothetical protein ACLGHE_10545, partial [Gammaproteobacteria bacterium]
METLNLIRSWLYLRKLKKRVDPLAAALGVEPSTELGRNGCLMQYYSFKDGNWITLTVWNGGFNIWHPDWQPGFEKNTEGFDLLKKA